MTLTIQENVPLAPLTTFGLGGRARLFVEAFSPEELVEAVAYCRAQNIDYRILAGGSNTLVSDMGFAGMVIHVTSSQCELQGATLACDAGVSLATAVHKLVAAGLAGIEKLSGVPGTIGGALVGNVEAYGCEVSSVVDRVEIFDGKQQRVLTRDECHFGYRDSVFKHEPWVILRVYLTAMHGDAAAVEETARSISEQRSKKYPKSMRCAGCYFKNVPAASLSPEVIKRVGAANIIRGNVPAGYLLEQVGARELKVGGVSVADVHTNILVCNGAGTSADVRAMAATLASRVKESFGIILEEEIRYIG